jgi:protein-S-isoprenylcysteine O-methyltransferase Ste14
MPLTEPMMLRCILFAGLTAHKLLWEVLKRRRAPEVSSTRGARGPLTVATKAMKMLVLLFLVVQTLFLDVLPIAAEPGVVRGVGLALFLVGLVMAVTGRLQLGRNWADLEDYTVLPGQSLVARGLYRYVRHPIYAGDIILLAGLELALNSWLVLAVLPVIIVVVRQARAEEALLLRTLPGYGEYCGRTKRFIPLIV